MEALMHHKSGPSVFVVLGDGEVMKIPFDESSLRVKVSKVLEAAAVARPERPAIKRGLLMGGRLLDGEVDLQSLGVSKGSTVTVVPLCSKMHQLKELCSVPSYYGGGILCDICRSGIQPSEGFLHCMPCKFDLCLSCRSLC
jgi:hypothetical protein